MATSNGQLNVVRKAGQTLVERCEMATSFVARFMGLMGRRSLPANAGVYFPKCNSIHTLFMRFPIDVVYLDGESRVVDVDSAVRPWRVSRPRWKAKNVLELAAGRAAALGITLGDRLEVV